MHGFGLAVDHKVTDRQRTSLLFRAIVIYYEQYFLLFYNILSIFVNANPAQEKIKTSEIFPNSCTNKNLPEIRQVFYIHPVGGYLLFGAALPQQLPHLGQLIRGDILPFQKCRKEAHDLRFVGMGIDRSGKVFFSCECGNECPAIGLAAFDKTRFPDGTFLQKAI